MSAITFPPAPHENGDTHIAENGVIYTWQDGGWMANQTSGLNDTYVNRSGDDMSGNLTVPSLNGGQLAGFRNQLINGDMRIWQRGVSGSGVSGFFGPDRWKRQSAGGSTSTTLAQITSPYAGFDYALRITSTDNTGSRLRTTVELPALGQAGPYIGTWTLSFYASTQLTIPPNLAFADGSDRLNAVSWTMGSLISLGSNKYSITATAATPVSTNDCICISFNPEGTDWNITGVQLEPGPVATEFEHRPISVELSMCQRYYCVDRNNYRLCLSSEGSNVRYHTYYFRSVMRTTPSVEVSLSTSAPGNSSFAIPEGYYLAVNVSSTTNTVSANVLTADAEL